jgi:hypothetical protein
VERLLGKNLTIAEFIKIQEQGKSILKDIATRNKALPIHFTDVVFVVRGRGEVYKGKGCWVTDYLNNSLVFEDNKVYNDPKMLYILIKPNFYDDHEKASISLFSIPESEIDVSVIAAKMGGGGHKHAAGFSAKGIEMWQGESESESEKTLQFTTYNGN